MRYLAPKCEFCGGPFRDVVVSPVDDGFVRENDFCSVVCSRDAVEHKKRYDGDRVADPLFVIKVSRIYENDLDDAAVVGFEYSVIYNDGVDPFCTTGYLEDAAEVRRNVKELLAKNPSARVEYEGPFAFYLEDPDDAHS